MTSTTKTMLASITDKGQRDAWKRAMVSAEAEAAVRPKREQSRPGAPGK